MIEMPQRPANPDAAPLAGAATRSRDWRRDYALRLWISDLLVLIWVVFGTQIVWFGTGAAELAIARGIVGGEVSYWTFSTTLVVVWMLALSFADTRDHRVIGAGPTEYVRIVRSSITLFGIIAIVAFLTQTEVARGFLLISLPVGVLVLILERWLWRQWLGGQRLRGRFSARALLVGSRASVTAIAAELARSAGSGYRVVGACVPGGDLTDRIAGTDVPVMGTVDDVERSLRASGADTVIVTSTDELPADKVKQISWLLRPGREHLVIAPSIADIAGPRIHTRPVAGLPLIHVETPHFQRGQSIVKRTVDIVLSAALIVLSSPILIATALIVRGTSPGPALYRQERIGRGGEPFHMLKFRSMRVGADAELHTLLEQQGTAQTPLFKIKDDPRITPVGRFLRKYSVDELPQLFNVLGGSMSIVGPRPQIAAEVALYSDAAKRRLLARPGITGLWQVSGRSTVGWEDAVRLDLFYVENWSLTGDLVILVKTIRAVLRPGATAV